MDGERVRGGWVAVGCVAGGWVRGRVDEWPVGGCDVGGWG